MKKYIFLISFIVVCITWISFYFTDGVYLLLDSVILPVRVFEISLWENFFSIIYKIANVFLWYVLFSKVFFVWVIFLYWLLWYYLAKFLNKYFEFKWKSAKLIYVSSILFFLINPFLYERVLNQLGVALASWLLWFWLYFLLKNLIKSEFKNYIYAWVFFWLSICVMSHAIFMVWIIFVLFTILNTRKDILNLFYSWLIVVLFNINWLIWWIFYPQDQTFQSLNSITDQNIQVFHANSLAWMGSELTSLLWYWFRWERYLHILTPDRFNPKRFVAGFFVVAVSMIWVWYLIVSSKTRKIWLFLLALALISLVLWVGTASTIWWKLVQSLYEYIPFYIWFRESHKWIGLLMLVYWITFSLWIKIVYEYFLNRYDYVKNIYIWYWIVFLLLFARTPWILFGFRGQLFLINYPQDYSKARDYLIGQNNSKVLALPWHSYVACDWTRWKVVVNIAQEYMKPANVIMADNIEIWNLYTNSSNPQSKDIEKFLQSKDLSFLKNNSFDHIINMKTCADFNNYEFLEKLDWIEKSFTTAQIDIYKIK